MRALKVVFLVLLTLVAMRAVSWFFGWLLSRFLKWKTAWAAVSTNLLALALFLCFLILERMPGELFDRSAFAFGAVVYAGFTVLDLKWWPWSKAGTQ